MPRVPESQLDAIIETNDLTIGAPPPANDSGKPGLLGTVQTPWTLPPCLRRILEEGVASHQRIACFRLAVVLRRIGFPFDLTVALLRTWRGKNHPSDGKRIITDQEVQAQTAFAYQKNYKGYGCDEPVIAAHCSPECPVHRSQNPNKKEATP